MKKARLRAWLAVLLTLGLMIPAWTSRVEAQNAAWPLIDGNQAATGLNQDAGKNAYTPQLAVLDGKLYAAWTEMTSNLAAQGRVYVSRYDGGDQWTLVSGANGLSLDPEQSVTTYVSLAAWNGELYAAWSENNGTVQQLRVKKYDPDSETWTFVDGGGTTGLNYDTAKHSQAMSLAVANGDLYVAWHENSSFGAAVHIKKYNPDNGQWDAVDGGANKGANKYGSGIAADIKIAGGGGKLYGTWIERSGGSFSGIAQVRVGEYDPTNSSWTLIDGNQDSGLNIDSAMAASSPQLIYYHDKLYVTWGESVSGSGQKIRVKAYDGSAWQSLDSDATHGLNFGTGGAANSTLAVIDDELYLGLMEYNGNQRARVEKLNEADGTWTFIDGNAATSGLNKKDSATAYSIALQDYEGTPYAIWNEQDSPNLYQIRAAKYSVGPSVASVAVPAADTYDRGETLTFTVQFSEAVDVTGTPRLPLAIGSQTRYADYSGGTGTNALQFAYAVQASDRDLDGIQTGSALDLNGGTIRNANSDDAVLSLSNVADTTGVNVDPQFRLTYDGNQNTGGTAPVDASGYVAGANAVVSGNSGSLVRAGYEFGGWNSSADGTGTHYGAGDHYPMTGADAALFAEWNPAYTIQAVTDQSMSPLFLGYAPGTQTAKTVAIKRTGAGELSGLTVAIGGAQANAFVLTQPSATTLDDTLNETSFTLAAKDGLALGTYTATVTVSADHMADATFTVTQTIYLKKGDVNGDGLVSPADALYITQYKAGKIALTDEQFDALDMNGDDVLDNADISSIMKIYLGVS